MTKILLVRHGQTDWNLAGRWQGHADIPLNETGLAQAEAVGKRLATEKIDAVYSSDLKRAAGTAAAIAKHHQLTVTHNPAWRERDVGIFSGLKHSEVAEKYPEFMADMNRGFFHPPEGEHPNEVYERMVEAYQALLPQHIDQQIVVVSHGGSLAALVRHILELPSEADRHFRIGGNTGISEITIHPQRGAQLTRLNDTAHLDSRFDSE